MVELGYEPFTELACLVAFRPSLRPRAQSGSPRCACAPLAKPLFRAKKLWQWGWPGEIYREGRLPLWPPPTPAALVLLFPPTL